MVFKAGAFSLLMFFLMFSMAYPEDENQGLLNAMVSLDRAYIPVLGITGHGKESYRQAIKAMERFQKEWLNFKEYNLGPVPKNKIADKDILKLDKVVNDAAYALNAGKDPLAAHAELEKIRKLLLEIRRTGRMDYFLDDLTEFHDSMEKVLALSQASGHNELLKSECDRAVVLLDRAASHISWADRHGLDAGPKKKLPEMIKKEKVILSGLIQAIGLKNRKEVQVSGQLMKKQFIEIFFLFGDFKDEKTKHKK
jgi:hypothetical protein